MSSADSMAERIRTKIAWHRAEAERLQGILDEFDPSAGGPRRERAADLIAPVPLPDWQPVPTFATPVKLKGLAFIEAVRRVLQEGESVNAKEIADRLRAGGYESDAKDFYSTVYNQLDQWAAKNSGIVKMGDRASGVLWRRY